MSKKTSKGQNDEFIKKMVDLFYRPNPENFQNDYTQEISKAQQYKNKSNSIKDFVNKIAKSEPNEKIFYDMISKLINHRDDFVSLMTIYLITDDKIRSDVLKRHYILKDTKMKKVENGNANGKPVFEFGVKLSCLYDIKTYYKSFISGILHYIELVFDNNYLHEYIKIDYFIKGSEYYEDNCRSLQTSLNKMLNDICRVIDKDSKNDINTIKENIELKMAKNQYSIFQAGAKLYRNKDITLIYENSETNEEILNKLRKLLNETPNNPENELFNNLSRLICDIDTYIIKEKFDNMQKTISNDNAIIYEQRMENQKLCEKIEDLEVEIKNVKDDNKKFKDENKKHKDENKKIIEDNKKIIENNKKIIEDNAKLNNQNSNLLTKVDNLETEVKNLKVKVEYMEPVLLSLISRKAINYSIIQILKSYKKSIKVTVSNIPNNKIKYDIKFIDSVNGINKETLNNLIDKIYLKKDIYNADSHLLNKEKPSFYDNIWNKVKENLKLDKNEITVFDGIITNEIKNDFVFGDKDLSVNDYLAGVNINEFGN